MPISINKNLDLEKIILPPWWWRSRRCRPRVLIVTDGGLNYRENDGFGLTRFIDAISNHSSVTLRPIITLAHRGVHISPVVISGTTYNVSTGFNFSTASPDVSTQNYDQIWLFGISGAPISDAEVRKIAEFMNAGGGVFSTGDHAHLGSQMSDRLPRIRHMRNWRASSSGGVPMGYESIPMSLNRIDTIVDPGSDNFYEFVDQSDNIPQRIYPNYKVTGTDANDWVATIHPVLRMPGSSLSRGPAFSGFGPAAFSNDIDVLPDHPHESECFEVSSSENTAAHNGTYSEANMSFQEFPNYEIGTGKIPAEIVAYSVSGGRSIHSGPSKPPVRPRMFGANCAFNGHLSAPISGTVRPGRIMCDATWHHFVNINLDGVGTSRNGLGSWNLAQTIFTASPDLLKIYKYFQNMIDWLQPSNRIWCLFYWYISEVYYRSPMREEFIDAIETKNLDDVRKIGMITSNAIDETIGLGTARMMVAAALRESKGGTKLAALLDPNAGELDSKEINEVIFGIIGQAAADLIPVLKEPGELEIEDNKKSAEKEEEKIYERFEASLQKGLIERVSSTIKEYLKSADKSRRRKVRSLKSALD